VDNSLKSHPYLKIFILGMVAMIATGCIRYHPKPIQAASSLENFEARKLDSSELKNHLLASGVVNEWPPPVWDLKSLTLAALYYHPDLDIARAQWGVAEAGRITAGERLNPGINPMIGYNSTTPLSEVTPWIPELALDIPIETAGKRGIRIAEARHLSESARRNVMAAAWGVRSGLRQAFLNLYLTERTETLLAEQLEYQTENVGLLELQFGVGQVSAFDLTQARIARDNSRLAALEASKQKAAAAISLAGALGVSAGALDGIRFSYDAFEHPPGEVPPADVRRKALLNRSDIMAALSEYAAAEQALRLEIAKQYPDINLGPDYQLDQTDSKWTLGISLILPLLSRNRGAIAEADAKRTETAARFLALQSKVLGDLDSAIASVRSAVLAAKTADEILGELKKREGSAKIRWQVGEISKVEYLGVELELSANALASLDALVKSQEAVGQLENAMQSPLDKSDWILATPKREPEPERRSCPVACRGGADREGSKGESLPWSQGWALCPAREGEEGRRMNSTPVGRGLPLQGEAKDRKQGARAC